MKTPYLETVERTLEHGRDYPDRTGKGRRRVFGAVERYDLRGNTLPADTTTQLFLKTLTKEILGFIKGSTDIKDLGVHFWRQWSPTEEDIEKHVERIKELAIASDHPEEEKEFWKNEDYLAAVKKGLAEHIDQIGPMYGAMWRNFPRVDKLPLPWVKSVDDIPSDKLKLYKERFAAEIVLLNQPERNTKENFEKFALGMFHQTFDQLAMVMKSLKENPYSSRHRITAYHPDTVGSEKLSPIENVLSGKAALTPCHSHVQFMVTDETHGEETLKTLNCMFYMSSSDVMVGRPYNICQYAIMTIIMAHCLDMVPGELMIVSCDTHIYTNHVNKVPEHLNRVPLPYPTITLPKDKKDIFDFTVDDIQINGYEHHPKIVYEVAV